MRTFAYAKHCRCFRRGPHFSSCRCPTLLPVTACNLPYLQQLPTRAGTRLHRTLAFCSSWEQVQLPEDLRRAHKPLCLRGVVPPRGRRVGGWRRGASKEEVGVLPPLATAQPVLQELDEALADALSVDEGWPLLMHLGRVEELLGSAMRTARFAEDCAPSPAVRKRAAELRASLSSWACAARARTSPLLQARLLTTVAQLCPEIRADMQAFMQGPCHLRRDATDDIHSAVEVLQQAVGKLSSTMPIQSSQPASICGMEGSSLLPPAGPPLPHQQVLMVCLWALHVFAGTASKAASVSRCAAYATSSWCCASGDNSMRASITQQRMAQCAAALARVAFDPAFAPALLLHEDQAALLQASLRHDSAASTCWMGPPAAAAITEPGTHSAPGRWYLPLYQQLLVWQDETLDPEKRNNKTLTLEDCLHVTDAANLELALHGGDLDGQVQCTPSMGPWTAVPSAAPLRALRLTRGVLLHLLQLYPNADVRQQAYLVLLSRRRALLEVLDELAVQRHALAMERGWPNYADMLLAGSILGGPGAGVELLQSLTPVLSDYVARDLRGLTNLEGASWSPTQQLPAVHDVEYLIGKALQSARRTSRCSWREFAPYFTLSTLLQGLDRLVAHMLGVRLRPIRVPLSGGCASAAVTAALRPSLRLALGLDTNKGSSTVDGAAMPACTLPRGLWSPDAHVLELLVEEGSTQGPAGLIVLDLFRGMDDALPFTTLLCHPSTALQVPSSNVTASLPVDGIAVIRMPFPDADESSGELRSPSFLRALLHEVGHALHLLLSGARHRHVALGATFCGVDLKELPAHLMEHCLRDPLCVQLMSCHWRLGVSLPRMQDALRLTQYLGAVFNVSTIDFQESVLAALADTVLHAELSYAPTPTAHAVGGTDADGSGAARASRTHASEIYTAVWATHSVLPGAEPTFEQVRQLETAGAIGGVKAAYVSAKLLAAAVWKQHFEAAPLDPEAGRRVRRCLLECGASVPPQIIVQRLLGPSSLRRAVNGYGWVPALDADVYQDIDLFS